LRRARNPRSSDAQPARIDENKPVGVNRARSSAVLHWNVKFKPVLTVLVVVAAVFASVMGCADTTYGIYW
jgi:hypothetical protein